MDLALKMRKVLTEANKSVSSRKNGTSQATAEVSPSRPVAVQGNGSTSKCTPKQTNEGDKPREVQKDLFKKNSCKKELRTNVFYFAIVFAFIVAIITSCYEHFNVLSPVLGRLASVFLFVMSNLKEMVLMIPMGAMYCNSQFLKKIEDDDSHRFIASFVWVFVLSFVCGIYMMLISALDIQEFISMKSCITILITTLALATIANQMLKHKLECKRLPEQAVITELASIQVPFDGLIKLVRDASDGFKVVFNCLASLLRFNTEIAKSVTATATTTAEVSTTMFSGLCATIGTSVGGAWSLAKTFALKALPAAWVPCSTAILTWLPWVTVGLVGSYLVYEYSSTIWVKVENLGKATVAKGTAIMAGTFAIMQYFLTYAITMILGISFLIVLYTTIRLCVFLATVKMSSQDVKCSNDNKNRIESITGKDGELSRYQQFAILYVVLFLGFALTGYYTCEFHDNDHCPALPTPTFKFWPHGLNSDLPDEELSNDQIIKKLNTSILNLRAELKEKKGLLGSAQLALNTTEETLNQTQASLANQMNETETYKQLHTELVAKNREYATSLVFLDKSDKNKCTSPEMPNTRVNTNACKANAVVAHAVKQVAQLIIDVQHADTYVTLYPTDRYPLIGDILDKSVESVKTYNEQVQRIVDNVHQMYDTIQDFNLDIESNSTDRMQWELNAFNLTTDLKKLKDIFEINKVRTVVEHRLKQQENAMYKVHASSHKDVKYRMAERLVTLLKDYLSNEDRSIDKNVMTRSEDDVNFLSSHCNVTRLKLQGVIKAFNEKTRETMFTGLRKFFGTMVGNVYIPQTIDTQTLHTIQADLEDVCATTFMGTRQAIVHHAFQTKVKFSDAPRQFIENYSNRYYDSQAKLFEGYEQTLRANTKLIENVLQSPNGKDYTPDLLKATVTLFQGTHQTEMNAKALADLNI